MAKEAFVVIVFDMIHFFFLIRNWIDSKRILQTSVVLYLAGIYYLPTGNSVKNFFYILVMFPFLTTITGAELRRLLSSKLIIAVWLFVTYYYLSISWNPETRQSEYFILLTRIFNLFVFIAALCRLIYREPDYISKIFNAIVHVAGVMAVVSITVFYTKYSFPTYRLENWGALYHPNAGASCYALAAVICYCHFILRASCKKRGLYFVILTVLLIDIAMTLSRGVWLALVLAFCVTQIMRGRYLLILTALLLSAAYLLLINFDVIEPSWYFTRDGGDNYRFAIWNKAFERIAGAPWFGYGVNADENLELSEVFTATHAHSVYLSHLIYGGIIGFLLLGTVILLSVRATYKLSLERSDTTYISMVIISSVSVASDFNQLLLNPGQVWYFFWFPIAMAAAVQLSANQVVVDPSHRAARKTSSVLRTADG